MRPPLASCGRRRALAAVVRRDRWCGTLASRTSAELDIAVAARDFGRDFASVFRRSFARSLPLLTGETKSPDRCFPAVDASGRGKGI